MEKSMFKFLVLISLFFGYCKGKNSSNPDNQEPLSALTLFTVGDVKLKLTRLKVGDSVSGREEISTGKSSCGDFQILTIDNAVIRLKENTKISLSEKLGNSHTVYIPNGEAFFNIKKLKKEESLNIVTPTLITGVRGTQFGVSVDKSGNSKVDLWEGSVSITPSLFELESLGEDLLKSAGIFDSLQTFKAKSETVLQPGQSLEAAGKTSADILKKIGWEEFKLKPETKELLIKKANSGLSAEDKGRLQTALNSFYGDPKMKERLNSGLKEDIKFSPAAIPAKDKDSKLEELKELIAVEKEKLAASQDLSIPAKERAKKMGDLLLKRISEITQDDIRTIKLKNGQTLKGVVSISETEVLVSTPEEVVRISRDQFDGYVD